MTFVLHLFGIEFARFSLVPIGEDESEYISNTGGAFDLPFGFAVAALPESDE